MVFVASAIERIGRRGAGDARLSRAVRTGIQGGADDHIHESVLLRRRPHELQIQMVASPRNHSSSDATSTSSIVSLNGKNAFVATRNQFYRPCSAGALSMRVSQRSLRDYFAVVVLRGGSNAPAVALLAYRISGGTSLVVMASSTGHRLIPGHRVVAHPRLGGLHHDYRLESRVA
jgi:hypothetical protein